MEDHRSSILDWACERIEGGASIQSLANELNEHYPDGVTRVMLHRILYKQDGADERIVQARRRGAPVLVEEAQEIIDNAQPDRDEIALAKERANIRLWQAERVDRAVYGKEPQVQINQNVLSISDLHLDALTSRKAASLPLGSPNDSLPSQRVIPAEIIVPRANTAD